MHLMKSMLVLLAAGLMAFSSQADPARILLIAGRQSHGPGDHEFRAGTLLIQRSLKGVPGVEVMVASNGWPAAMSAFEGVSAVVIYADGGAGHPAIQQDRMNFIHGLAKKGVGLGFMHYGVEVPKGDPGQAMQEWIGGYYEHEYSCNPMWAPEFRTFPEHPVTRGVRPFSIRDEWYFNMRFREDMKGVTPILVALPSDAVRDGPYVWPKGPYAHIREAKGRPETMMWVREREDGGRGLGFTGGHFHRNWGNAEFRKIILNGMLWLAKVEVPAGGVESVLEEGALAQNLDPKGGK
jgi:type 1 glutamine amidotransferase